MRLAAWIGIKPHIKAGTLKKPSDLFPFEWDDKKTATVKQLTEAEKLKLKKWDHA